MPVMMLDGAVVLTLDEWDRLQDDSKLLAHLHANGVDNWEGYSTPDDDNWEDELLRGLNGNTAG